MFMRLRVYCSGKQATTTRWPLHVEQSSRTAKILLSSRVRLFCPSLSDSVEATLSALNLNPNLNLSSPRSVPGACAERGLCSRAKSEGRLRQA